MDFFKNWDDWGPLERSLPVVSVLRGSNGRSLLERSLISGRIIVAFKIDSVLTGCDGRSLLERLLPVVSVLSGGWQTSDRG